MTLPIKNRLNIDHMELSIHIGWSEQERDHAQRIRLDLEIDFGKWVPACETDQLTDTLCYDKLIMTIQSQVQKKTYHLIEHLARDVYLIFRQHSPKDSKLSVRITKFPKIVGLRGNVSFTYYDENSAW